MKVVVWVVFGVVALLWTAAALLAAELVQWAVAALTAGNAASVADAATAQWPAWIAALIDPAWLRAMQDAALWATQALRDGSPWIGGALGWLVPVVWVFWGLGVMALLLAAGGSHLLAGWASSRLRAA
jgi:hypothetical protein